MKQRGVMDGVEAGVSKKKPEQISRSDWEAIGAIDSFLSKTFGSKIKEKDVIEQINKIRLDHKLNIHTMGELLSYCRGTEESEWKSRPLFFSALVEEVSKRRIVIKD